MVKVKEFKNRFLPAKFSFRSERDLERLYSFYLEELVRRHVSANKKPKIIFTPHQFSVQLSLDAVEEIESTDLPIFTVQEGKRINLLAFLDDMTNPKRRVNLHRLTEEDAEIYRSMFLNNSFAGNLRPEDLQKQKSQKNPMQELQDLRKARLESYEQQIEKFLTTVKFQAELADLTTRIERNELFISDFDQETRFTKIEAVALDQLSPPAQNRVHFENINIFIENPEQMQYLNDLVERYGETLFPSREVSFFDQYGPIDLNV